MGHGQVMDHMFLDGLEDAYDKGKLMGVFAENYRRRITASPASSRTSSRSDRCSARRRAIESRRFRRRDYVPVVHDVAPG